MTEVTSAASVNGTEPAPFAAKIAGELRELIEERTQRLEAIDAERREVAEELKVYRAALAPLTGESPRKRKKPAASTGTPARGTAIGPERLAAIEAAVRTFAADHDEFRQVDIRSMVGDKAGNSSVMAAAFEQLRQANVIRFARKDGAQKFFRLTNTALREQP